MKRSVLSFALMMLPVMAFCALGEQGEARSSAKYVAFAWEFNSTSAKDLLDLADEFDKTPLDGVGIKPRAVAEVNGKKTVLSYRHFMHQEAWPKEAFADQIPVFKKLTAHKSMKHCFLNSFAAPRTRISWTDDAEWERIAKSMRTVAWLAKQGGLKGLTIDPEDYRNAFQFTRMAGEMEYDELCRLVRRRGREVFAPVFEEYPDITLHFFWFMSHVNYYIRRDGGDPVRMARIDEALWPAFLNGIIDVLPPEASINDGDEESYRHTAANNGYRNGAYLFHCVYPKLVSPENLGKYRRQVKYAPAVYMEMYVNPKGSSWYKAPTGSSRLETLRRDLRQAGDVCGGYIWFWGERRTWVDHGKGWSKGDHRILDTTWARELPGLFRAMEWARDPKSLCDREFAALEKSGGAKNLAPSEEVVVCNENVEVASKPSRDWERLGIFNAFVTNSVVGVKGGAWYAVSFDVKGNSPRFNVFFSDGKGKDVPPTINFVYPDHGRGRGVVRAPEGSANATLVFGAKNVPGGKTVYSNVKFMEIEDER